MANRSEQQVASQNTKASPIGADLVRLLDSADSNASAAATVASLPISTAQQAALDLKADDADLTSHTGNTSNPHSVTKTQVGLGNVQNVDTTTTANITDSSDKRFMTDAQESKLDGVESGADVTDATNVAAAGAAMASNNLSDLSSASTARTNLGLGSAASADTADFDAAGAASTVQGNLDTHTGNTSNPHSVTAEQVGLGSVENTALSTWAGSVNITTLGTINTGVWNGTAIDDAYIASAATWNAKQDALTAASQAEMEAGTETAIRSMSPLRVKQAIDALGGGGGSSSSVVYAGDVILNASDLPITPVGNLIAARGAIFGGSGDGSSWRKNSGNGGSADSGSNNTYFYNGNSTNGGGNFLGGIRLSTGTDAGLDGHGYCTVGYDDMGSPQYSPKFGQIAGSTKYTTRIFISRFALTVASDATDEYTVQVGFIGGRGSTPSTSAGAQLNYNYDVNSGDFVAFTSYDGSSTSSNTTFTPTFNGSGNITTAIDVAVVFLGSGNSGAGSYKFYARNVTNDTTPGAWTELTEITTNIPLMNNWNRNCVAGVLINRIAGTTNNRLMYAGHAADLIYLKG